METAVVVGAGLKAIVAARMLVARGHRVILVDSANRLGGVHTSVPWDGFRLDLGCHLFGNEDDASTGLLLDLMGGAANPITPRIASVFRGVRTDGIEYPDFAHGDPGEVAAALLGLLDCAAARAGEMPAPPDPAVSLHDYLVARFGVAAAALVEKACGKMLPAPAAGLSAAAFSALPARRLKLTGDGTAELLKQLPALDAVLLRSNADDPMRYLRNRASAFPARALYPTAGGMGGFARTATDRLRELGVELRLGTDVVGLAQAGATVRLGVGDGSQIDADLLVWTAGAGRLAAALGEDADRLDAAIESVPMVLHYFDVPEAAAGPYHWIHDFDDRDMVFRASVPSLFGPDTAPPGRHYVCAEIPTDPGSETFRNPEAGAGDVWTEIVRLGVAAGPLPDRRRSIAVGASYRFPTTAFPAAFARLEDRLANMPSVLSSDEFEFGKSASVRSIERLLARAGT